VSVRSRLEGLEGRARLRRSVSEGSAQARARMLEHLEQMVRLKRGELGPEEAAEVEAANAAFEARLAQMRGEGGLLG
jgi:hypothetical protein